MQAIRVPARTELQAALAQFGTPEEIAATLLRLAAKESGFIVGTAFFADGGWARCEAGPTAAASLLVPGNSCLLWHSFASTAWFVSDGFPGAAQHFVITHRPGHQPKPRGAACAQLAAALLISARPLQQHADGGHQHLDRDGLFQMKVEPRL